MAVLPSLVFTVALAFTLLVPAPATLLSAAAELADCGPQLLPLASCAPYVQGATPAPARSCCDNVAELFSQQPKCLCLLINGSSSLPINQTLALRLPLLCNLNILPSACPGDLPPAATPETEAAVASAENSSTGAPAAGPFPRASLLSHGEKPDSNEGLWALIAAATTVIVEDLLGPL